MPGRFHAVDDRRGEVSRSIVQDAIPNLRLWSHLRVTEHLLDHRVGVLLGT